MSVCHNSFLPSFRTSGGSRPYLRFTIPFKDKQWALTSNYRDSVKYVKKWIPPNEGNITYTRYIEGRARRVYDLSRSFYYEEAIQIQQMFAQKLRIISQKKIESGHIYELLVNRVDDISYIILFLKKFYCDCFSVTFGSKDIPSEKSRYDILQMFKNSIVETCV